MPPVDVTGAALSAGSKVGRAFSVTSLIPSLFLVSLTWAVVVSGAATAAPDLSRLSRAASHLGLGDAAAALLLAFLIGYVLHPVQFALTQMLEGYWGTSSAGQALMVWGVRRFRRRQSRWNNELDAAQERLRGMDEAEIASDLGTSTAVPDVIIEQQLSKALDDLPDDPARVMPTKLGNVLRRHEDLAGRAYGLPGVATVPPLTLVGAPERTAYLSEASEQLDVSVSVCVVTAMATVIVAAATLTDGWWLLSALVPYVLCVIAYHGAVSVAHAYGIAMRRLIDLDRFALYEELHLRLPTTTEEEDEVTATVNAQLAGGRAFTAFVHSAAPAADAT